MRTAEEVPRGWPSGCRGGGATEIVAPARDASTHLGE